ncbi:hypothetical protein [Saccharomonospora glauca]|uniref:Uncharacterized protein n=1 Tax=Saccharomonospora glauca K62 TaxID=928724 RepID=I1D7C5_9PSEU|nr:hypothetical protein [Saccharomonospora glauca]EIF00850.1 hypothetical protein SacglDRAFT_04008 [Saccharomonospora glauca K62]
MDESLPKDGFAVPLRLHNVLLALAGRLDDTALSEARELVARSHLDDAAELAVGALIAGRIMVRPSEQRELALVLEMSRSDTALADQLTVGEPVSEPTHRFSRDNDPDAGIAEALDRTLQVLPDVRSVHAVWRTTPAGSVPGPLPQRVVLIEIGPEAHPPAVAFRVAEALRRSGIRAVVEVTGPGAERTEYHETALLSATPVWLASEQASSEGKNNASGSRSRSSRKVTAGAARARAEAARRPAHAMTEPSEPVQPEARHTLPEPPVEEIAPTGGESWSAGASEARGADEIRPEPGDVLPEPAEVRAESVDLPPAPVEGPPEPGDVRPESTEARSEAVEALPEPVEARAEAVDVLPDPVEARPEPVEACAEAAESQPEPTEPAKLPKPREKAEKLSFSAEELAELENRVAETTEMSPEEVAQLRAAIAEDPEKGRELVGLPASMVELPELNLDDPQLSERDRQLLRELHAELAERERAEAARTNGAERPWRDGSSS